MNQLQALYSKSVQQTISKVYEDIDRYTEKYEELPSFEMYVSDQRAYITQIWLNAWLNITTGRASITDKKEFLKDRGFDFNGLSRKQINLLFRQEMRTYPAFDVIEWLYEKYLGQDEIWENKYDHARSKFLLKENERLKSENKSKLINDITSVIDNLIKQNRLDLYLKTRYFIANKVKVDITEKGYLVADPYITLLTFFEEMDEEVLLTQVSRKYFQRETFYELYESYVTSHMFEGIPEWLLNQLPSELFAKYSEIFGKPLSKSSIEELAYDRLYDIGLDIFDDLQDEYLSHLLELATYSFELSDHKEILIRDTEHREKIEEEKIVEFEKRKIEEKRMLEDIFGREFSPPVGRDIKYVLHVGATNTGKTFQALKRMKEASSGLYLAPLRLLALEVYDKLNADGVPCSLKTGEEEKIIQSARHISCTVEMFHEKDFYEVITIDEAQMVADKDRGFSWFKAITKANAKEVHIIGSSNMKHMILQLLGNSKVEVNTYSRDIPLEVEAIEFALKQTKKGDALVCFSRKRVLETASILQEKKYKVSMIYGSMPPETRKKQMQQFIDGETSVIVATDAIGMGLNLPIRRIVFLQNEKFDGTRRRRLKSQEVKQIAGRAGRKGIYDIGKVAFTEDIKMMTRLLQQEDEPLHTFAIAPTSGIFDRFQKYSRNLGKFFELWNKFESPEGTRKASLTEERDLYEMIRESVIEARLSIMDLYGFLHMPFSSKEPKLLDQWRETMYSIVEGRELPEPIIKTDGLEDLELSYKALGLHLLFLYRLDKRTETMYWERVREKISEEIHQILKTDVKIAQKKCQRCGDNLSNDFKFNICDKCHRNQYSRNRIHQRRR